MSVHRFSYSMCEISGKFYISNSIMNNVVIKWKQRIYKTPILTKQEEKTGIADISDACDGQVLSEIVVIDFRKILGSGTSTYTLHCT